MDKIVFQIVGYKNSGKTTLICRLIEKLVEKGIRAAVIKHDAHEFEMDHVDTDTWKHRKAGAQVVAITSEHRTAMIKEQPTPLDKVIEQLYEDVDLILVEGYKYEHYPKLLIVKAKDDLALLKQLINVRAVVTRLSEDHDEWDTELPYPSFSVGEEAEILQVILSIE